MSGYTGQSRDSELLPPPHRQDGIFSNRLVAEEGADLNPGFCVHRSSFIELSLSHQAIQVLFLGLGQQNHIN